MTTLNPTRMQPLKELPARMRLLPNLGEAWCPVCTSDAVVPGRLHVELLAGKRVVLHRNSAGDLHALEDRCPHRGVPLSRGTWTERGVRCGYHGMLVDVQGLCSGALARTYAVREKYGLVWILVGEFIRADHVPMHDLAPFGAGSHLDTWMCMDINAHWSLVMDNGLDMTHGHLHRDQPYFFSELDLAEVQGTVDGVSVAYQAKLRDEWYRMRVGQIRLDLVGATFLADFGGQPVVRSVTTPRSADGRKVTQWWWFSFAASRWARPFYALALPLVRKFIWDAFLQDKEMLEHESRAVFEDGFVQRERNPAVLDANVHLLAMVNERCRQMLSLLPVEQISRYDALRQLESGELAFVARDPAVPSPMTAAEVAAATHGCETIQVQRYWQMALVDL